MSIATFWSITNDYPATTENDIAVGIITKSTLKGQKLTLYLEDGTQVKLNANSKITYPDRFDSLRTIHLVGEAYFEIAEDPDRPFEVITEGFKTSVIGTVFGIDHDSGKRRIKVAVLEGKVRVDALGTDDSGQSYSILEPSEMVSISVEDELFEEGTFDYNAFFGWKDDLLVFKNAGFTDVVGKLENWYGVNFVIRKEISTEKDFTGEYWNESLENVLVGIGYTFDFEYEIRGATVLVKQYDGP